MIPNANLDIESESKLTQAKQVGQAKELHAVATESTCIKNILIWMILKGNYAEVACSFAVSLLICS